MYVAELKWRVTAKYLYHKFISLIFYYMQLAKVLSPIWRKRHNHLHHCRHHHRNPDRVCVLHLLLQALQLCLPSQALFQEHQKMLVP